MSNKSVLLLFIVVVIVSFFATPYIASLQTKAAIEPIKDDSISVVHLGNAIIVGADGDDIILKNNSNAHDPTWDELCGFLQVDQTDRQLYINDKFTCGDYAEMLHNNAEASHIKTAFVVILLDVVSGNPRHALDAFYVIGRGIVFIDDTGTSNGRYADKVANVEQGSVYRVKGMFPTLGQTMEWKDDAVVKKVEVIWW
jgi:hypothetical protein